MTASVSTSRSFVGSSRTSRLGPPISSLSSSRRRSSPPERSPIRVMAFSPLKPKSSSRVPAETVLPPISISRRSRSTLGSTRSSGFPATIVCGRVAATTVVPITIVPASGSRWPVSSRTSVVLPAPFGPRRPTRSPGPSCQVRSSISVRSLAGSPGPPTPGTRSATDSRSTTCRPSRADATRRSASLSRSSGTSAISALAASIRNCGLEVRAGGPRRSHASSLLTRLRRRDSATASRRSRSARARTHAA